MGCKIKGSPEFLDRDYTSIPVPIYPEKLKDLPYPKIVATYRIKNEERWIEKSLKAASEICQEIVILDDGSTAIEITGARKSIDSRSIGSFFEHKVSPVLVFFKPTIAAISPVVIFCLSSLLLECISIKRPILSSFSEFGL